MTKGTHCLWTRRVDVPAGDPRSTPRAAFYGSIKQCRDEMKFQQMATDEAKWAMPYPPRDYLIIKRDSNGTAAFREFDEAHADLVAKGKGK